MKNKTGHLISKCIKVIQSCNTKEQLNTAERYIYLAKKRLRKSENPIVLDLVFYEMNRYFYTQEWKIANDNTVDFAPCSEGSS